jgi:hypothetical protein
VLVTPSESANSLDVFLATHRGQLKEHPNVLEQWLRFHARLEAGPALSWTAGLLAELLHLVDIIKLPLFCKTHEWTPTRTAREKR